MYRNKCSLSLTKFFGILIIIVENISNYPLCWWDLCFFCFLRQHGRDSVGENGESESPNEVATGATLVTDLTSQMGRSQFLQELNRKPPGLTQEALDCLDQEVFNNSETVLESRVIQDCSICLETFTDGDELIRLPCRHKFHSVCLDPWIRCCGDCPYCRRHVVLNTHLPKYDNE